ncbi:hypothetical protein [Paraflavitalea sp. CAU 1676]|uniref:hypothetical protein n=1 Tax=Paraflavitalea sp. CAU 1676 TaxID=3032598 RepID=UPI0023DB109D|nr:hypothetical protein [Paraflavitalea sp. CAU 1676]MDF2187140.1 hypothetical protein [Paraflavitalea sp. CAU 1676]
MLRNLKSLYLPLVGMLLFHGMVNAQDPVAFEPAVFPTVIAPSPHAFSMTKYGDMPIGLFTGTAQFNVPVYNITSGKISHPISIDYATNGVKVDEIASRVGMNWSLKAGGVITRKVLGLPDDISGVFRHKPASHDPSSWEMYYFLKENVEPADPQPDEYSFNFDGNSGKFIILDGVIKPLKYTAVKFEKVATDVFMATTPNGYRYYFGENLAYEESESKKYYEFERPTIYNKAKTAWYLTRIIGTNNDTLQFSYTKGSSFTLTGASDVYNFLPQNTMQLTYYNYWIGSISVPTRNNCYPPEQYKLSVHTSSGSVQQLDEIVFNDGKVKFYYSDREDLTFDKRIDSIRIMGVEGAIIKTMKLNYVYSTNSDTSYYLMAYNSKVQDLYPNLRKRLFLESIEEIGRGNVTGGKYKFEYNDIDQIAPRLSMSQDLCGYFNGKINSKLFPNDTYVGDINRYGGDRSFDSAFAVKGTLKRIIYPTGGYSEVEYEPHNIYGLPKKAIVYDTVKLKVSNPSGYNYRVITMDTWTASMHINIKPIVSWIGAPPPIEQIRGDEGAIISVYDLATNECVVCGIPVPVGANTEIDQLLPNSYNRTLYGAVTITHPGIKAEVVFVGKDLEVVSNTNQPFGGLRVKAIQSFDGLGNYANRKQYVYSSFDMPDRSSGSVTFPGEPSINNVMVSSYKVFDPRFPQWSGYDCAYYTLSSSGIVDLYLNDYNTVSYSNVTELFEGRNDTGGIEHKFNVTLSSPARPLNYNWMVEDGDNSPIMIPGAPSSNDNYHNGEEHYTGTFILRNGTKKYSEKKYSYFSRDERLFNQDTAYAARKVVSRDSYVSSSRYNGDYNLNRYFINQFWTHLDSTITINYEGSDSLQSKVAYTYGNLLNLLPTRIETRNSKRETVVKILQYPDDFDAPLNAYRLMLERNMVGEPIYTKKEKNGVPLLSTFVEYDGFAGGLILPKLITNKNEITGATEKLSYDAYDGKGNVLENHKVNDIHTSFIWDYNYTYPIAKIDNASNDRVAYSSFEADGLGGWSFNSGSVVVVAVDAITGKKVLSGGVNKVVPQGNYVVGVWSKGIPSINGQVLTQLPIKVLGQWKYFVVKLLNVSAVEVAGEQIDEVRLHPQTSQMTTYTFDPLVGMTSLSDVNNRITYYEYDDLGRLKTIRDENRNVLKTLDYQFQKSYNQ